jgi:hypothetical protein
VVGIQIEGTAETCDTIFAILGVPVELTEDRVDGDRVGEYRSGRFDQTDTGLALAAGEYTGPRVQQGNQIEVQAIGAACLQLVESRDHAVNAIGYVYCEHFVGHGWPFRLCETEPDEAEHSQEYRDSFEHK